jgi:hypothetical protein
MQLNKRQQSMFGTTLSSGWDQWASENVDVVMSLSLLLLLLLVLLLVFKQACRQAASRLLLLRQAGRSIFSEQCSSGCASSAWRPRCFSTGPQQGALIITCGFACLLALFGACLAVNKTHTWVSG